MIMKRVTPDVGRANQPGGLRGRLASRRHSGRTTRDFRLLTNERRSTALGRTSCEAIWKRTRDYVARYSATRISREDDTAIETERPHEFGVLYLWASRTLVPGEIPGPQESA